MGAGTSIFYYNKLVSKEKIQPRKVFIRTYGWPMDAVRTTA
jgi:hypothetical protein